MEPVGDLARGAFVELDRGTGGLRAHYHEVGTGPNHVLLVQSGGAGASAYMTWRWNFEAFANAGYHVLAPDMPGYGLTPPAEVLPTVIDAAVRVCFVLPDCSCTLLSRCGHWPQIERADEFN